MFTVKVHVIISCSSTLFSALPADSPQYSPGSITVEVVSLEAVCLLHITSCTVLEVMRGTSPSPLSEENPNISVCHIIDGERWKTKDTMKVVFSKRCAKFLNLQIGSHIKLSPPW